MDTIHRPRAHRAGRRLTVYVAVASVLTLGSAATAGAVQHVADRPTLTWGETRTYGDGLEVTVARPTAFTPSATSAGHRSGNRAVAWKITLRNPAGEAFETALVAVYAKYGKAGEQAERVFDSAKAIGSGFEGSVSPGRSATATYVFDIPKAGTDLLDLEVVPHVVTHDGTHWTGPLSPKTGRG
ncbi:hypothetical protein [Streptomyces sp. WM6373]|uniref:hypothetical protein n=1 Tax=Streptomyces sp. WM6373 TaxID=1415556 RepID=UPI0006AF4411|nr:hypothetical protein [Streptomyces sp. WM6373]